MYYSVEVITANLGTAQGWVSYPLLVPPYVPPRWLLFISALPLLLWGASFYSLPFDSVRSGPYPWRGPFATLVLGVTFPDTTYGLPGANYPDPVKRPLVARLAAPPVMSPSPLVFRVDSTVSLTFSKSKRHASFISVGSELWLLWSLSDLANPAYRMWTIALVPDYFGTGLTGTPTAAHRVISHTSRHPPPQWSQVPCFYVWMWSTYRKQGEFLVFSWSFRY